MVRALAPVAPPCFSARDVWLSYLAAAAAEQRLEHEPGPLVFTRDGVDLDTDAGLSTAGIGLNVPVLIFKNRRVSFNAQMNFCEECTTTYRREMLAAGRCNPKHLIQTLEPEPA